MTNRVLVELSYNKKVLIDVADLPKLMDILDGATVVAYDYVEDGRVNYVENDGYTLEFSQAPAVHYHTEEELAAMKQAEYERKNPDAGDVVAQDDAA